MCSLMTTPYFKRVLEDMQSGYQPDQTSSNSIYLRPRTSPFRPPGVQEYINEYIDVTNPRSIITRLRIWVRKAMNRRTRRWNDDYHNHYGGFGRNLVGRSGWGVTASLRNPTYFGQAIEQSKHLLSAAASASGGASPTVLSGSAINHTFLPTI